jgi:acetyltransferase-like isoleucine patch superfamily enzyme
MKMHKFLKYLYCIPVSIFFCVKYLPFRQAIKVPILLYKPTFELLKGKVIINSSIIKFGMIKLGFKHNHTFHSGIIFSNSGGILEFRGKGIIGSESKIIIGTYGHLILGENFGVSASEFLCDWKIEFGNDLSVGKGCIFMDCDFHQFNILKKNNKSMPAKAYSPITIGKNNWFGFNCYILKGTTTPNNIIIGLHSILNKKYLIPEYSIIAGVPAVLKKTGYYRNPQNDKVNFNLNRNDNKK